MSSIRYDYASELFLNGEIDWRSDPVVCLLVGTASYTYQNTHRYLSDIPVAARVAQSGTFENRSSTLGVADADDVIVAGVSGPRVDALVILRFTGQASDSVLISYQNDAVGLPFDPDGSDVRIHWDNTQFRIFKL